MKHFTTEKWIDFANEVVSASERESMEKHLQSGCKRCLETVSVWQRVRQSAATEKNYQPPATTVQIAKAMFSGARLKDQRKEARNLITMLFDSFLQPAVEGARTVACNSRQVLYRADPFQVDVHIEPKPGGGFLIVTGQLLDLSSPEVVGKDVAVTLSNMRGHTIYAISNQFGEFAGEIKNSGDLQISFSNPSGDPIVISLRDALGRLN